MQIILNGEPYQLRQADSVASLLVELQHENRRVAVELNREIIPRSRFSSTRLCDGDQIEIVHAIGGG